MKVISFETAKLAKEKGFDIPIQHTVDNINQLYDVDNNKISVHSNAVDNWNKFDTVMSAPTIAQVVMWLYEKHGIWIIAEHHFQKFIYWGFVITKPNDSEFIEGNSQYFWKSPTEAYEAAIKYTLNNLI